MNRPRHRLWRLVLAAALLVAAPAADGLADRVHGPAAAAARHHQGAARASTRPRRSQALTRTQQGKAGYYHSRFNGRRMANGQRFDPRADIAAHKSLPLGTMVRVTNLENGRSAVARVTDRGPYVRGRIIDVAPRVAERLDMRRDGIVRVAVTPLATSAGD